MYECTGNVFVLLRISAAFKNWQAFVNVKCFLSAGIIRRKSQPFETNKRYGAIKSMIEKANCQSYTKIGTAHTENE